MSTEQTLSIIKPDAVRRNLIGKIIQRFEDNGLSVVACKLIRLNVQRASEFYAEHKGRPFFNDLVQYMSSGPVLVQVISGEGAISRNREIMGDTDPAKASPGTIRADFAESIEANAVHGSDSADSAAREIEFFFSATEFCERD
jgi:nucleoside-diphosphate kinase